jgi:DNA-directed RNA polymerase subunit RPC12/RpoP
MSPVSLPKPPTCPECGSTRIHHGKPPIKPNGQKSAGIEAHCQECGHYF